MNALIQTKYIGPTNYRGARLKAFLLAQPSVSVFYPYPHELSGEDAHRKAAEKLAQKLGYGKEQEAFEAIRGYVFSFSK